MKIEISTYVILVNRSGAVYRFFDFKDSQSALKFLDQQIRSDKYVQGQIMLKIKKG